MKTLKIVSLFIVVLLLISVSGYAATAPGVTVLKFAHVNGPDHPYQITATKFAQLISERTNGKVIVETFHSGQLGNERELIEQCKLGSVDFVVTASAPWGNFMPELMVFDLPFLFRDRAHAYKVLDGPIGKPYLQKMDKQNVIGLAFWENGFRHTSNSKREVKTPADLKGLKIRLMENPVHLGTFKALGAMPTPMAWGEVFTALQQKTIDGMENSPVVYVTSNLFEVQKYLSLTGHFYSPAPFIMNKDKMNKLPKDIQAIILKTSIEMRDYERKVHLELDEKNLKVLRDKGMTITTVDPNLFREKCTALYDEYKAKLGADTINNIINTK
jgi:tripartite ATP-independent transporter DctP family solute receptor